jgi:hypothetical protein
LRQSEPLNPISPLDINKNVSEDTALDELYSVAASAKAKRSLLRKRNRIGKTPFEKINWTSEEVSHLLHFNINLWFKSLIIVVLL